MSAKYAVIDAHRPAYSVQLMCEALDVAPSGYFVARQRPPSAHAVADDAMLGPIRASFRASHATCGAPRIHADLKAVGHVVAKKRVARLMQES